MQPAVEVVAAEMETVLYAQMLALFAPQVRTAPRIPPLGDALKRLNLCGLRLQ